MKVGFIVYPQVTTIDFTGPAQVLRLIPNSEIYLISFEYDAVPIDAGLVKI